MNDTPAPRMIPVVVIVTPADADKYGRHAWDVASSVDENGAEGDPRSTIETVPLTVGADAVAAMLHLARTHSDHRIARFGYSSELSSEMQVETDNFDVRAYRAELRLIAKS